MISEEIIKRLDKYFKRDWSLLEINALEGPGIEKIIENEKKSLKENMLNWLSWIGQMVHGEHKHLVQKLFTDCDTKVCQSLRDSIEELR